MCGSDWLSATGLRVAFDENIPSAMVRIFGILAKERQLQWLFGGLIIETAKDYTPKKGDPDYAKNNDVPWITRFAEAGGRVIISGNTDMKSQAHERLALVEQGMVTIFFEGQWSKWPFFRKCALLLHWWPAIVKTAKSSEPGTFWHVPCDWSEDGALRSVPNGDAKLIKLARQMAQREVKRAARRVRRLSEQPNLDLENSTK
jgi:hypothetical protein